MLGTVQVSYVSHIAFEPFIADIAKEHLLLLALLISLYSSHIFFDIEILLSADEHTLLLRCLCDCFLLMIALHSLLDFEFLTAEFIVLCCYRTLCLQGLAHLLYTTIITHPILILGWNY